MTREVQEGEGGIRWDRPGERRANHRTAHRNNFHTFIVIVRLRVQTDTQRHACGEPRSVLIRRRLPERIRRNRHKETFRSWSESQNSTDQPEINTEVQEVPPSPAGQEPRDPCPQGVSEVT